jgi:molecular chaperone HscB
MTDLFERLGLPRRFSVDAGEVERNYLARARECHPDLHGLTTDEEKAAALERSASLNRAYATLADPARRAEHLLALLGGPTAGQEKSLDQSFLMEMMETREQMDELRAAGSDLRELEADLVRRYERTMADVADRFEKPGAGELVAIRRCLNAARTIQSLLRDLRGSPDPN